MSGSWTVGESIRARPPERILFESPVAKIGAFRCPVDHGAFENSGPIENDCVVFPRTAVIIHHDHEAAFVANANVVTLYNRRDDYRRYAVSPDGDRCDWFALSPPVLRDVAAAIDPSTEGRPEQPFQLSRVASDPRLYAFQRRVVDALSAGEELDPLAVEEAVIEITRRLLVRARRREAAPPAALASGRLRALVRDAERLLSERFAERLSLAAIASRLDVSAFHLCRAFRRVTGSTLHGYLVQLRLRASLEPLAAAGRGDVVRCALDAGFCSHSHYGSAFRRAFGEPPSAYVRSLGSNRCARERRDERDRAEQSGPGRRARRDGRSA